MLMWYNLNNAFELQKFRDRVVELQNKHTIVELTEKKPRSIQSSKYLYLMLSQFALMYGYTLDETKTHFFYKVVVNPEIFVRERLDKFTGEIYKYVRSTADLTKDEMSESIEKFRLWAKEEAGFDFPSSDEYIALLHIQHDLRHNKQHL